MPAEKKDRNAIISRAIGIASEEERAAYIAEACGDDDDKKRQVEQRVAGHFQNGNEEESSPKENTRSPSAEKGNEHKGGSEHYGANHKDGRESQITHIGPYKVVKQIGEGVAGLVFQGEQQEPVRLKVAIKLIKEGMSWRQIVSRFAVERQSLLRIDHPNIAKVLGAGTRQSGQPYFVMELVEGLPLTKYCDENQLPLDRRLELFVSVCRAVQYAHQKGVLHGDLKPSNVLVASQDDKPAPKILGLGIARATRQKPNECSASADPSVLGGKPEYMSPEQASSDDPDIDIRSDVYSLGVLLYELLTGTTPLSPERLKDVSRTETLRLVREEEAPPPGDRLEDSRDRLRRVAEKRQMKPEELLKSVSGELSCVVKKALQKDRTQRYETVHDLADEIQRYLADEPIEACPPSSTRQIWKLTKKSPMILAVTGGMLLLLLVLALGGAGLGIWEWHQADKAQQAEQKADEKRKKTEEEEKKLKSKLHESEQVREIREKERDKARAKEKAAQNSENEIKGILRFFKKTLLSTGRPSDVSLEKAFWAGTQGKMDATVRKNITLRQAVDETEAKVAETFADLPMAEASVREMLGLAYLNLGAAEQGVQQLKRAFELREALHGEKADDTARCRNELAIAYRLNGQHDAASRLFGQSPNSSQQAFALVVRGRMLLLEKKPAEAEIKLRESLKIRQKVQPDYWTTFETKSLLGEALLEQKKYAEAEPLMMSGYRGMKKREDKIPDREKVQLTKALERLVHLYDTWDKPDEAAKWRKELDKTEPAKNP